MAEKRFTKAEIHRIEAAVTEAELNTSGEIRVHVERRCPEELLDRAAYIFEKLKMHKTALRNGVLFYLAVDDHLFAILGDAGINSVVPENFWDTIQEEMAAKFRKNDLAGGLVTGILMAGESLKQHFPYQKNDINELPDEISFGR
jgi:uncharacterized membrane protein